MRSPAAARRYARALFSLAEESGRIDEVRAELDQLTGLLDDNRDLHEAMLTPLHPAEERKAVLDQLIQTAGLSPTVRHFYAFLIDRRRLVDHKGIYDEYVRLAEEAAGNLTAEVVAASPLGPDHEQRLRDALSRRTGRNVNLEVRVDASLIGGAIAKVGDLVFDGSLRTQLSQLHANLTKGS